MAVTPAEKAALLGTLTSLYNEGVHANEQFLICNVQQIYKSGLYFLIGASQSLTLSSLSDASIELIKRVVRETEKVRLAEALLGYLRQTMKPQFVMIYHNASAMHPFLHSFIWTHLDKMPHLAVAVGHERSLSSAAETFSGFDIVTQQKVAITMGETEAAAREALTNLSQLPEALKAKTYALVPVSAIEPEKQARPLLGADDAARQAFEMMDKCVTEMLCEVCPMNELSAYRRLWHFIRGVEGLQITPDGLVISTSDGAHEMSLLTLLRECMKRPPPARRPDGAQTKKKKKDVNLMSAVHIMREALSNSSFPSHLILNTRLRTLASK
jgi:hypothetical protein